MRVVKQTFGKTFSERVLECALQVPLGRVTTYGRIAKAAGGGAMASRSVTGILGKAWVAGEHRIPWHRIVYADGRPWMSEQYADERKKLYKKEGIAIGKDGRIEDFEDIVFDFR